MKAKRTRGGEKRLDKLAFVVKKYFELLFEASLKVIILVILAPIVLYLVIFYPEDFAPKSKLKVNL